MADGRVERGRRRREELVEAALRVVERDGVSAVTHRAVAREAHVADTAGTYHFRTVDDLLVAAITAGARRFADELRHHPPSTVADLAGLLVDYLTHRRGTAIAEYELYLLAARRPALRPAARLWLDAARDAMSPWAADADALGVAVLVCDGLLLQGLIADEPPGVDEITTALTRVLRDQRSCG